MTFSPYFSFLSILDGFSGTEQKGNAPKSRQGDYRVDDTADKGILSAEDPRYQIKLEQANAAPVHGANDDQQQCDSVQKHSECCEGMIPPLSCRIIVLPQILR